MKENNNLPFLINTDQNDKTKLPAKKKTEDERKIDFIREVFTRNPVGRPRMYTHTEELEANINEYFNYCYDNKIKFTITGLTLFCGFSNRKSFYEYEQNSEFTHAIKKARSLIEMHYELALQEAFPQGAVFALKNLGWNAEEQIETTVKKKVKFVVRAQSDDEEDYTPHEEIE